MSTNAVHCDRRLKFARICKVRQHCKTPSEVCALLRIQNPFPPLAVELTGVWAGPLCPAPLSPSGCRGGCFPAHPVRGACGTDGALLLQGWHGQRGLVFLCFPWPCHSTTGTLSASLWGVYAPGAGPRSRRLWLEVLQFTGPINTKHHKPRREYGWVGWWAMLLLAGMISSFCRAWKRWGLQCLLLLWIRTLGLEIGQKCMDEESVKAGEKDGTFHTESCGSKAGRIFV